MSVTKKKKKEKKRHLVLAKFEPFAMQRFHAEERRWYEDKAEIRIMWPQAKEC